MRLILLRHAKSEKAEAGQRDHARRLNARGRDDAPMIGAYMARHGLVPDRALVSSAARTRETWERVAAALAAQPQAIHEERLYNANSEGILALVKETESGVRTLLLVGHNPGLEDLIEHLTGEAYGLATAALVQLELPIDSWSELDTSVSATLVDTWQPKDAN